MVTRRELREISQRAAADQRGRRHVVRTLYGGWLVITAILAGAVWLADRSGLTSAVGSVSGLLVAGLVVLVVALVCGVLFKRYLDGY